VRQIGLTEVRSTDGVTQVEEYLCYATHADATYANKVDAFDFSPHGVSSIAIIHYLTRSTPKYLVKI
jgi:S-adenosylmethionine/arginine decarboxylase-like enzyme